MCNIWQKEIEQPVGFETFSKIISDPIFKKVNSVGINGGEPILIKNLIEYVKIILKMPRLKSLNIISNGFLTDRILNLCQDIYSLCKERDIKFHIAISLDGVGKIHDLVRGTPGIFVKVNATITELKKNREQYCDTFNVSCTVIKQNINNLIELEQYVELQGLDIGYRLGVDIKRIYSDEIIENFSVIGTEDQQTAIEFFYRQFRKSKDINQKFKYYSIFYWLSKKKKRLLGCDWKQDGITLDGRGNVYYCAVASERLGNIIQNSGTEIFFSKKNIKYRELLCKNCNSCIHDYGGKIEIMNAFLFIKELISIRMSMFTFRFLGLFH